MALSDDNFSPLELKMLYHFAEERNIPKDTLDRILLSPSEHFPIPAELEERLEYLYDLALMIWADGNVSDDELVTMKKYCKKFEFLDENIDELTSLLLEKAKDNIAFEEIIKDLK